MELKPRDDGARHRRRRAALFSDRASVPPGLAPEWADLVPDVGDAGVQRLGRTAPLFARLAGLRADPRQRCPGCGALAFLTHFTIEHFHAGCWQSELGLPYVGACPACLHATYEAAWAIPDGPWWHTPRTEGS